MVKYELRSFYNFTLKKYYNWSISYIQKTNLKIFSPKGWHFCTAKIVGNQKNVKSFSDSAPSKCLKKMFCASTPFQIFLFFVDQCYHSVSSFISSDIFPQKSFFHVWCEMKCKWRYAVKWFTLTIYAIHFSCFFNLSRLLKKLTVVV